MRFLADEGVDRQVVEALRAVDLDVTYVAELDPGIRDPEVLALAVREQRLLITSDKGFGELVFRQRRASHGVILLRLAGVDPAVKAERVASVIQQHGAGLPGSFTVVTSRLTRIRPAARPA